MGSGRLTARTVLLAAIASAAMTATAGAASLYTGPGPRPGPDLLYAPPATSPQLTNAGVWTAPSLLVSGASAYRDGEFLYQDFLYDDHGANAGTRDPGDPRSSGDTFSQPNGTYTYPTNPVYAGNAADLVELRVKPLADATAFRITLNTLKDPALVATTIAIGGDPAVPQSFPHGAGVSAPAQYFLTVHGTTAELVDGATKAPIPGGPPTATVDLARRQIEVRVPHAEWNPGTGVVRLAAGVGLWDTAAGAYLRPQAAADATHPGGAGALPTPPALFNVAFRYNGYSQQTAVPAGTEPFPKPNDQQNSVDPAWWRDRAQGTALRNGDITAFFANVDFGKLAAGTDDDMPGQVRGTPVAGAMDRILASHFETAQGTDYSTTCGVSTGCKGELRGALQPYAIYVPSPSPPPGGYGMTLLLHSLAANYNQYESTKNQSQFGDPGLRGPGSIVITPEGRGPDGWYYDYAGADTWEVWADVAARYTLDPAFTVITGYSMGGYGTFKFATQFPDLFAKAQPTVGPPGLGVWVPPNPPQPGGDQSNTYRQLESVRNIPFDMWDATTDELVPFAGTEAQARRFDALGYRYEFRAYQPADHLTLAINDEYTPAAQFLGSDKVDRDPAHVSYVYNPTMDFAALGTASGHAYWVSGVRLRDGSGTAPLGKVDVRSEGFGTGDPTPSGTIVGADVLTGGTLPAISYTSQSQKWGAVPATPVRNRLDVNATNVSALSIDAPRARVSCNVELNVTSDGPVAITIAGCPGGPRVFDSAKAVCARDTRSFAFRLHARRGERVVRATAYVNGKRVKTVRGHRITRLSIRPLAHRRYVVKIVTVTQRGTRTTSTRTYRACSKTRPRTRRTPARRAAGPRFTG